jgi:DNA-directed RNA polymerase specialized sigma24 family protein
MGRMPPSGDPNPADEAFARLLFREVFQSRVEKASWPIFPKALEREIEDIIDRALQRAYEKRSQYLGQSDDDLLAWVLAILRNLTRDILRSEKGRPLFKPLSETHEDKRVPSIRETPDEELGDEIPMPPLPAIAWTMTTQTLLEMLSDADRDVLLLRLGHDLSVKETAQFLSVPGKPVSEAAVKMRLGRAIKRLTAFAQRIGMFRQRVSSSEEGAGAGEPGQEEE